MGKSQNYHGFSPSDSLFAANAPHSFPWSSHETDFRAASTAAAIDSAASRWSPSVTWE